MYYVTEYELKRRKSRVRQLKRRVVRLNISIFIMRTGLLLDKVLSLPRKACLKLADWVRPEEE